MTKKFDVIVADCPWVFSDPLEMSVVKRSAQSQYDTLTLDEIKKLPVKKIAADDSILVLWVPGSFLQEGLDTMRFWGFDQKQIHVWVKTKNSPLKDLYKIIPNIWTIFKPLAKLKNEQIDSSLIKEVAKDTNAVMRHMLIDNNFGFSNWKLDNILAFGMGRLFRQTHEIALVGTRGKIYSKLKNKSQRSVHFGPVTKHSAKPEDLQDMLDIMFPNSKKIELFARRPRKGWICLGNQCPGTEGEDIRDSLKKFISKKDFEEQYLESNAIINFKKSLINSCKKTLRKKSLKRPRSWIPSKLSDYEKLEGKKLEAKRLLEILRQG